MESFLASADGEVEMESVLGTEGLVLALLFPRNMGTTGLVAVVHSKPNVATSAITPTHA
jgi:hypothetical protein